MESSPLSRVEKKETMTVYVNLSKRLVMLM